MAIEIKNSNKPSVQTERLVEVSDPFGELTLPRGDDSGPFRSLTPPKDGVYVQGIPGTTRHFAGGMTFQSEPENEPGQNVVNANDNTLDSPRSFNMPGLIRSVSIPNSTELAEPEAEPTANTIIVSAAGIKRLSSNFEPELGRQEMDGGYGEPYALVIGPQGVRLGSEALAA
ncbi:MAG: hypothetical protein GX589_10985 [Deltaproteobacteria bacterium]|nr:hypothetical protein [Deltaproteobacteria bacterium]